MRKLRNFLPLAMLSSGAALTMASYVTGRIIDPGGEGYPGALVSLYRGTDTVPAAGSYTDADGRFAIQDVAPGRYRITVASLDAKPANLSLTVPDSVDTLHIEPVTLSDDATMLAEVVVRGVKTAVIAKEDTLEYNADSYHTAVNATVGDLLKRLPGVTVGSDGSISSGGKTITKILVDGKEFFGDDPQAATKNLPSSMIDKVQVVDRKSDLARMTGVDDGEEETVINLTVKKGMQNGWFGNAEAGYGTDSRYMGTFNVNRFWNDNQITVLGGLNNINQPGFTDGGSGRFRRFGGDNGITLSQALGLNFNVGNKEIFRVGGDVMYSHTSARTITRQDRQYLFEDSTSYLNTDKLAHDRGHNIRGDFRIQWNPDSMNTFEFRPRISYNQNDSWSLDSSLTRSGRLEDVTKSINRISSDGKSWEFGAQLIYNHKFRNRPGRSFSVHVNFSSSNVRESESSYSWNRFFLMNDSIDLYDQEADNHTWANTLNTRVSWTEPLGNPKNGNFLTFAYTFRYRWNNADKMVYEYPVTWPDGWDGDPIISDELTWREDLSNRFRNHYMNQDIRAGYKHVSKSSTLDVGLSLVPQKSTSIDLINVERNITRNVLNYAPYLRYRLRLSKTRSFSINYRGRSSQPSMSQLQPVADYSDPLRVVIGNPNLDPTFTHNVGIRYSDFDTHSQRSVMAMVNAQVEQNAIVSRTTFSAETGGQTTTYQNVNGVWNVMGMGMVSMPLRNKNWRVNFHTSGRYAHTIGFNNGQRNLSRSLMVNVMPAIAFRPDNLEVEVRPRYSLQSTATSLQNNNRTVHSYGAMFNGTWYTAFGLVLSTDVNWAKTSGYSSGYDSNQALWDATLSYRFLRDESLTLSLKAYDLLQQKKSIRRSETGNYIDDTMYNSLTRYFMVTLSWKFNTFGKGNEPQGRNQRRFGPLGGGPGGPPPHR